MTTKDVQDLARLIGKVPGIKSVELKDVRQLAELLHEFPEIGSIEVRGFFDTGVVITRTGSGAPQAAQVLAPAPLPAAAVAAPAAAAAAAAPAATPAASTLKDVKSPMVGTFYKSPEPGAEPYVKVGSRIAVGQTVCIIEAMKIFNEIKAECSGTIAKVLVKNGEPVEFGQALFLVKPA